MVPWASLKSWTRPLCTAPSWSTATGKMVQCVFLVRIHVVRSLHDGGMSCGLSVAVMHIAWYSEDKPFAVGYADGKLLIGSKEPLEKGAIVVIEAHKVK